MTTPPRVAVLFYPAKAGAEAMAGRIAAEIAAAGAARARAFSLRDIDPEELRGCTLAITVGGDGSILGAARACAQVGLPLLPVQMGRLGHLAELEIGDLRAELPHYLRGDCRRDARLMLTATLEGDGAELAGGLPALNEVVVARGVSSGPIRVDVRLGGVHYGTVWADGLIVSTPTGSTAYARSAGGPIVHPDVPSLSLTCVAPQSGPPHLLAVAPDERVELLVTTDAGDWVLLADGLVRAQPPSGATLTVTRSPHQTVFLRRGDRYRLQRRLRDMLTGNPRPGITMPEDL